MNLITGSEGFIGSHLMRHVAEPVVGYDTKSGQFVDQVVRGLKPKVVYHLGSKVGMGESHYRPWEYCSDNVSGTAALLEALEKENTVEHIVLASSVTAMLGGSPYAITKKAQEELCRVWCDRNNVTLSVLRLYNVYGPGQSLTNPYSGVVANFAQKLLAGESPTVFEDGLQLRDFVHVDDVVRAMLFAAVDRFDGVAEVGTGSGTSIIDVANWLREYLGGPLPLITGEHRLGDVREMRADTKAAAKFGWRPTISFQTGLAEYAESLVGQRVDGVADAAEELRMAGALK